MMMTHDAYDTDYCRTNKYKTNNEPAMADENIAVCQTQFRLLLTSEQGL